MSVGSATKTTPNPSFEATSSGKLRLLPAAAHVKRYGSMYLTNRL
jgi:hypothetical protein